MKIFYAKNSNGNYLSADGKTRYVKLYGKAAYAYLRSDEGKLKRFVKISDSDNSDDIYLEIDTGSIPSFRVDERREQYVRDIKRESGICVISIYACEGHGDDEDKASGEELIADDSFNLETEVLKQIDMTTLRKALKTQIPVGIILYEMKKGLNKRFFQKKHEKRLIFLSKYSIIRLYL